MCYAVTCAKCGKCTWAGCGRHVASVYLNIPAGQHCLCREWPGVKPNADGGVSGSAAIEQPASSSCTVL